MALMFWFKRSVLKLFYPSGHLKGVRRLHFLEPPVNIHIPEAIQQAVNCFNQFQSVKKEGKKRAPRRILRNTRLCVWFMSHLNPYDPFGSISALSLTI